MKKNTLLKPATSIAPVAAPTSKPENVSQLARLALSAASKFKQDYVQLSRELFHSEAAQNGLHHAGEFGRYREQLLQHFLSAFLPHRLAVGDGFVTTTAGNLSTQCDTIIYERDANPHLMASGGRAIFPLELCAAVGEAKSVLTYQQLRDALKKLRVTKRMRAQFQPFGAPVAPVSVVIGTSHYMRDKMAEGDPDFLKHIREYYRPHHEESHNLVTFVVCESIKWEDGADCAKPDSLGFQNALNALYEDKADPYLTHNFILSLTQGLLSYSFTQPGTHPPRRLPYPYPVQSRYRSPSISDHEPTRCGWRWLPAGNHNHHIMTFAAELIHAATEVPIFAFDPQAHSMDPQGYDYHYIPAS